MFANQLQVMLFCVSLVKFLTIVWYKMLLQYAGQLVDLPDDPVRQASFHICSATKTTWFQKLASWSSEYGFQGLIAKVDVMVPFQYQMP